MIETCSPLFFKKVYHAFIFFKLAKPINLWNYGNEEETSTYMVENPCIIRNEDYTGSNIDTYNMCNPFYNEIIKENIVWREFLKIWILGNMCNLNLIWYIWEVLSTHLSLMKEWLQEKWETLG